MQIEGLFVRLTVQRRSHPEAIKRSQPVMRPYCSHIEFYVKSGQEFIIELPRYEISMQRRWAPGHCIKMFWADELDPHQVRRNIFHRNVFTLWSYKFARSLRSLAHFWSL